MNSSLQNIHLLCNVERRKETVEFVGNNAKKVSDVECTVCNMGRVEVIYWVQLCCGFVIDLVL